MIVSRRGGEGNPATTIAAGTVTVTIVDARSTQGCTKNLSVNGTGTASAA